MVNIYRDEKVAMELLRRQQIETEAALGKNFEEAKATLEELAKDIDVMSEEDFRRNFYLNSGSGKGKQLESVLTDLGFRTTRFSPFFARSFIRKNEGKKEKELLTLDYYRDIFGEKFSENRKSFIYLHQMPIGQDLGQFPYDLRRSRKEFSKKELEAERYAKVTGTLIGLTAVQLGVSIALSVDGIGDGSYVQKGIVGALTTLGMGAISYIHYKRSFPPNKSGIFNEITDGDALRYIAQNLNLTSSTENP